MLNVVDASPSLCRPGMSRRSFLQVSALGLGGLSLADLIAARAARSRGHDVRDKAVVLLFLQGGPPQHETFDPKMGVPPRSTTGGGSRRRLTSPQSRPASWPGTTPAGCVSEGGAISTIRPDHGGLSRRAITTEVRERE